MAIGVILCISIIASVTLKPNIQHINGILSIVGTLLGLSICALSYLEYRNDKKLRKKK